MKMLSIKRKYLLVIFIGVLISLGTQDSYGQTITASAETPLTEANLHGSIITLTLTGRNFTEDEWKIEESVSVSGIEGVTVDIFFGVDRVSDTEVTVKLTFTGNIDEDATLTFTVKAWAIVGYSGDALTATLPVTAVEESLEASTEAPLTEATLHGSIITLTLTGRNLIERGWVIDALSFSGIEGVTVERAVGQLVDATTATVTVELTFSGNIDEDATLTLTVGAYNKDFTFQFPVTAVAESLEASTEASLSEATLHGSIITLTLTGRQFRDRLYSVDDAFSVSGIEGAAVDRYGVNSVTDTEATVELIFSGNIDEDATLTLTVDPAAIVGGYDKSFTFEFPVTAVEESLVISTEFPLTEATLDRSTITLTLTGRQFVRGSSDLTSALSVSGTEGVSLREYVSWRSDTQINATLLFSGNIDTDATLTFTVGADAIIGYNQGFTAQFPVTAIQQSNATLNLSPASVILPAIGEQLSFNLNITGGENVAGYQATIAYDRNALSLVDTTEGNYLLQDTFFFPNTYYRSVELIATTLDEAANGDGTLATLTFEVLDFKASTLTLSNVYLVDADGTRWEVTTENAEITLPPEPAEPIFGDINHDGIVNTQDLVMVSLLLGIRGQNIADINGDGVVNIVDLVLVAGAINNEDAAAPPSNPQALEPLMTEHVQNWLSQARQLTLTDPAYLRGTHMLEQLLRTLTPKKTTLLPNYPNPFNPETWIPYHLSNDVEVHISIYNTKGALVRRLDLGHQTAGYYINRMKAAYWDAKNEFGEQVASGVYFYHLSAGNYSATRKMLILQ